MTPEEIYAQLTAGAPKKRTKGYARLGDGTYLKWILANPAQALAMISSIISLFAKPADPPAPQPAPAEEPAA